MGRRQHQEHSKKTNVLELHILQVWIHINKLLIWEIKLVI